MLKIYFVIAFTCLTCNIVYPQTVGVGVAYATSNTMDMEILLRKDNNVFKLGGSMQFSDRTGKQVDNQASNYGQTVDGKGEYFLMIDLGWGRVVKDRWTFDAELSLGANKHYTNYVDKRFNDDGYHIVTSKESIFGAGINAGYIIGRNWNFFTGFNTIRKLQFGIRVWL